MGFQAGYINNSGSPAIKIWVFGAYIQLMAEFEAVIDTGLHGISLDASCKGVPFGTATGWHHSVALADGKTHSKFIATCNASITGDTKDPAAWNAGIVILEPVSSDTLLGMEFLRTFRKTLAVYANARQVGLIDDTDVDELQKVFGQPKAPSP